MHTGAGERISATRATVLDPIDPGTLHAYVLPAGTPVALQRHHNNGYWWFVVGASLMTLWAEATGAREYRRQPGDRVACP